MSNKFHETENGTKLPLMNLKGKDYLQVAYRIVWFREKEPQSGIKTNVVALTEDYAVMHAEILRNGVVVASATKREVKKDFADFVEKAETGAIGRALALLGYGTQFTLPDLDEGARLADAPLETPKLASKVETQTTVVQTTPAVVADVLKNTTVAAPVAQATTATPRRTFPKPGNKTNGNVSSFD
jgi:hypothetical protein